MKKSLVHVLGTLFVSTLLAGCSFGGTTDPSNPSGPSGPTDSRIPISSIADLAQLNNSKGNFKLDADLDFSEYGNWTPINGFKGQLDGENHTITNFNYEFTADDNVGFFGTLEGNVNNLTISGNLVAKGGCNNVGLLAGTNKGIISGIKTAGSITAEYSTNVGGVAGYTTYRFGSCENSATVVGLNSVGGVAGYVYLKVGQTIDSGSDNKATVSGQTNIGGVYGYIYSSEYSTGYGVEMQIPNSHNTGNITASKDYVGGVVGIIVSKNGNTIALSYCSNSGTIKGDNYVSGIVGGGTRLGQILYCENTGDVTASGSYVGGYVGGSTSAVVVDATNNTSIEGSTYVGGVAGLAKSVSGSENKGTVKCTGYDTVDNKMVARFGGVVGSATTVNNCKNTGTLNVVTQGGRVGGVAGELTLTGEAQTIESNENKSNIVAQGNDVGGVFGYISSELHRSYNTFNIELKKNKNSGTITSNSNHVGGIVGQFYGKLSSGSHTNGRLTFNTNENTGNITGFKYVGGLVGYANRALDDENMWPTNTQTGIIVSTGGEYSGNYYGVINDTL